MIAAAEAARKGDEHRYRLYNRYHDRQNVERIPGRTVAALQGNIVDVAKAGAANLVDGLDFIGEKTRELFGDDSLNPPIPPRKPVPMPTERPPQRTGMVQA
jgi:hypothetical protein